MSCKVKQAITGFFRGLVTAALNPVFKVLGSSLLSSPRVDQMDRTRQLWTTSAWIANTSFVLLITVGGIVVMGHGTLQTSYTAKQIAPRLVVGMVAANTSLLWIGKAIEFANAISAALMGQGVDPGKAAETLKGLVVQAISDSSGPFMAILSVMALVLGLVVVLVYVVRIMLLVLLTAAAPLALTCHALPQTEGLARLWWRGLAGVLAIQVAQALVLITALKVFFSSDQDAVFGVRPPKSLLDLLLVICLLYVLMRIPSWVSRMVWHGGLSSSPIVRAAKTVAAVVVFRRMFPRRTPTPRPPRPRPVRSATMGGDGAVTPADIGRNAPHVTWQPRNPIRRMWPRRQPPVKGGEGSAAPTDVMSRAPRVSWPPEQRRYPPGKGAPPKRPPRPPRHPMPPRPWPYNTRPYNPPRRRPPGGADPSSN